MANWEHMNKKIIKVDFHTDVTIVEYECGHKGNLNPTFSYKIGTSGQCYICAKTRYDELLKKGA